MPSITGSTNPTGLKEIHRKDISIIRSQKDGRRAFTISKLELHPYGFHPTDAIVVIARAGSTSVRADIGSISKWEAGPIDISDLDESAPTRFRVLVKKPESPKLIATAENIKWGGEGDLESLLPIEPADIGERIWKLALSEDGPTLLCNVKVFPSGPSAEAYVPFRAMVLPEALAMVLLDVARHSDRLEEEGSVWADWKTWMTDCNIELPPPADEELHEKWVTEAVAMFCELHKPASELRSFIDGVEGQ